MTAPAQMQDQSSEIARVVATSHPWQWVITLQWLAGQIKLLSAVAAR
ncbi:hypothetical protein RS9916_40336 [Synechococcus sp. RS9916]|nr:hypothetical protein RS9916_40336 [Synechococcus sp. RS9916]